MKGVPFSRGLGPHRLAQPLPRLPTAEEVPELMLSDPTRPATRISVKLHRRVCLVQTEDAVLAEELLARKKLAQDIVGRLTDRVLLVRPGRVDAVIQELQKMGHTPQVSK